MSAPPIRLLLFDDFDNGVIVDVAFAVEVEHDRAVLVIVNVDLPLVGGDEVAVVAVHVHDSFKSAVHIRTAALELPVAGRTAGKEKQRGKQAKYCDHPKEMFHWSHLKSDFLFSFLF